MEKKSFNVIISILFLAVILSSCARLPTETPTTYRTTTSQTKTYQTSEIVTFEGVQFKINSTEFASSFYNWVNQPSYPNATFLIIDISITNLRTEAIPFHFRPLFTLVDENGVKYERSEQGTIMINMGRRGSFDPIEILNPNVVSTNKFVFDVPKQKYKLQVLVPYRAQMAFGGYNRMTGRFFYFDLSSIVE